MVSTLAFFGLALPHCVFDSIKCGVVGVRSLIFFSDLLIYYVSVFFEGKSVIVIYRDFNLFLR